MTLLGSGVLTDIVAIDKLQIEDATLEAIRWFSDIGLTDVALVGGKGANLGELTAAGLPVPPGFMVTAAACHETVWRAGVGLSGRATSGGEVALLAVLLR